MEATLKKLSIKWYEKIFPLRIDIVGDYAGSSRFLIHGESLLRHCFSDPLIDFDPGFQLLHAVYVVEQFLQNIVRRKCQFDIVFLDEHAKLCVPDTVASGGRFLLAREIIMRHLMAMPIENGEIKQFSGVRDNELHKWVGVRRPLFIMALDQEKEYNENDSEADDAAENAMLLFNLMHLGEGYNLVLINRVEFVDSRIFTYVVETTHHHGRYSIRPTQHKSEVETPSGVTEFSDNASIRENLAVYAVTNMFSQELGVMQDYAEDASVYLLHTALLSILSLDERHWVDEATQATTERVTSFLEHLSSCICDNLHSRHLKIDPTQGLCDFVDGRLMLNLFTNGAGNLPASVMEKFNSLCVAAKTGLSEKGISITFEIPPKLLSSNHALSVTTSDEVTCQKSSLLPFTNPIFDPHLESIRLAIDEDASSSLESSSGQIYRETTHWHNSKKPLIHKKPWKPLKKPTIIRAAPTGKGQSGSLMERRQMGRLRKTDQLFLKQMQRYAASLTGAIGGMLDPKLIICETADDRKKKAIETKKAASKEDQNKKPPVVKNGKDGKSGKGGKAPAKKAAKPSKAEAIKLENAEKSAAKEAKILVTAWKRLHQELSTSKDMDRQITRLEEHTAKLQKSLPSNPAEGHEGRFIIDEIRLFKIQLFQKRWATLANTEERRLGYSIVAALFEEARQLLMSSSLTARIKSILTKVFAKLRIALPPCLLTDQQLSQRDLIFSTAWDGTLNENMKLNMTSTEFQLLHFGPYMDRNMDSKPDDRVSFHPDRWQREVLDEIDNDNSVLVVAPTSAGKTFISFHAMEKVLKAADDGILVYVAPTKALVNQIAAEVMSRFRKNYKTSGKTVWAIHTRDYRVNDPSNCQILVTVPHILAIMLLAPTNANKWSPRVKRIIFDEVHSIGNADDGLVWEQLLLLAPCPIIALSATVGNPEEFSDWLQSTQGAMGHKLTMIKHPYRYSDLSKYIYKPTTQETKLFTGLGKLDKFGQVAFIDGLKAVHPVCSLLDASQGMPDDLSLEPKDCLTLYLAMKQVMTKSHPVPKALDYTQVFGMDGTVIKKIDVINWEISLKSVLKDWMSDSTSPFQDLLKLLSKDVNLLSVNHDSETRDPTLQDASNETENDDDEEDEYKEPDISGKAEDEKPSERKPLFRDTLPLLRELHAQNALPAILFCYDRKMCGLICLWLYKDLIDGENAWRATDPKFQSILAQWEAWKKARSSRSAKPKPLVVQSKDEMQREIAEAESGFIENFDPMEPSPGFSFADPKKCSNAEFEEEISYLLRDPALATSPLIQCLKRGVGIHHAGMNRKYRQAVEMLFRRGFLRVVIATGTLALGINMPCKTVIFAGDSVYLTALNYRQAAGRAGRRGFDLIGNVIFLDIPTNRALKLMSSRLPSLMGHFPVSTSLILRLFILLHNSQESEHAKKSINSLLTQPRLVIGGESYKQQTLHHLRFSIEFLRKQKLIDFDGTPLNFAGMTTHLYYDEAGAFSLHALLTSGYFSDICEKINNPNREEDICLKLMLVLCHTFGRIPAPPGSKIPTLPPLPQRVTKIINSYNQDTLNTFSTYVQTFAEQYCHTPDDKLPFSKRQCGGPGLSSENAEKKPFKARSSFVSLSGHSGAFSSIRSLTSSVRSDIFLEPSVVPYLPVNTEPLNSYLYAFYKDGDTAKMERENKIRKADQWFVLKEFSLILATIVAGLECYVKEGPGGYVDEERIRGAGEGEPEEEGRDEGSDMEESGKEETEDEDEDDDDEEEDDEDEDDWEKLETMGYKKVLKAFLKLREGFEEKFRKIFA
ncbi:hypothetical protein BZA77DRAFT_282187 [Pyronema omphalodes]|nr:hypothetical protein BZA77DRAFT_282187 [Pyronema omphalodes]